MFTLVLINGREYEITSAERESFLKGPGMVLVPRLGITINTASISVIEPAGLGRKAVDRNKQMTGVTPSGEIVIKRFGRWFIQNPASPYMRDDDGNSLEEYQGNPILPTPEEYELKYKALPESEWTPALIGQSSELDDRLLIDRTNRTSTEGLTHA